MMAPPRKSPDASPATMAMRMGKGGAGGSGLGAGVKTRRKRLSASVASRVPSPESRAPHSPLQRPLGLLDEGVQLRRPLRARGAGREVGLDLGHELVRAEHELVELFDGLDVLGLEAAAAQPFL